MLPAMLTALAVVREKELGSIINLYVTPVTRVEFLLGKQPPYVAAGHAQLLLMRPGGGHRCLACPITGSFATLDAGGLLFSVSPPGMGLLASTVTRSQIAAMFCHDRHHHPGHRSFRADRPGVVAGGRAAGMGEVIRPATCSPSAGRVQQGAHAAGTCTAEFWLALAIPGHHRHCHCCCCKQEALNAVALAVLTLANIFRLGIKELWSLWRDPMMLVLIVYTFTAWRSTPPPRPCPRRCTRAHRHRG